MGNADLATLALDLVRHIRVDVNRALVGATDSEATFFGRLDDRLAELLPSGTAVEPGGDDSLQWLSVALGLVPPDHRSMMQAVIDIAPHLTWSTPYASVDASGELDHFKANYTYARLTATDAEAGSTGPLTCRGGRELALFVTVQGPETAYPLHHHPAVEIYGVIAGTGQWLRGSESFRPRRAGEVFLHTTEMVHATTTTSEPTISWAAWLNDLETPPVLA